MTTPSPLDGLREEIRVALRGVETDEFTADELMTSISARVMPLIAAADEMRKAWEDCHIRNPLDIGAVEAAADAYDLARIAAVGGA